LFPSYKTFFSHSEKSDELNYRLLDELSNQKLIVIIHGLFAKNTENILYFLRKYRIPIILCHHGGKSRLEKFKEKNNIIRYILLIYERYLYKNSYFFFSSNRSQNLFIKNYSNNYTLSNTGINFARLNVSKKSSRQKLNLPLDKKIFLFVGRFVKSKGFFDLVNVANNLKNFHFICVGGNPDTLPSTSDFSNIELVDRVSSEILSHYYNSADVFVLPTHSEGRSTSTLEAIYYDLPVVTTRTGNYDEYSMFTDKLFFCEINSPVSLSENLQLVLKYSKKKKNRKREMEKYYGWDRVVNHHTRLYKKLSNEYYGK